MTGKDVLKMLLCLHGYDRNVKVESYRGEGNAIVECNRIRSVCRECRW